MAKYKKPRYEPFGRPTKYKPEYCEQLFEHMAEGLSYETFGVQIGVTTSTLYEWEKKYSDFSEAKKSGFGACQAYWETMGRNSMRDKSFNTAMWIYNMKCRFRKSESWGALDEDRTPSVNVKLSYDPKKLSEGE